MINEKGSRNITVENIKFKWKVTGNDGFVTVVIWPVNEKNIKLIGTFAYHDEYEKNFDKDVYIKTRGQIIITNRVIRTIIEYIGVKEILNSKMPVNLGALECLYDINNALRVPIELP